MTASNDHEIFFILCVCVPNYFTYSQCVWSWKLFHENLFGACFTKYLTNEDRQLLGDHWPQWQLNGNSFINLWWTQETCPSGCAWIFLQLKVQASAAMQRFYKIWNCSHWKTELYIKPHGVNTSGINLQQSKLSYQAYTRSHVTNSLTFDYRLGKHSVGMVTRM